MLDFIYMKTAPAGVSGAAIVFFFCYTFSFESGYTLKYRKKCGYTWIGYTTEFFKLMAIPNLAIPQKSGYTLLGYTL